MCINKIQWKWGTYTKNCSFYSQKCCKKLKLTTKRLMEKEQAIPYIKVKTCKITKLIELLLSSTNCSFKGLPLVGVEHMLINPAHPKY